MGNNGQILSRDRQILLILFVILFKFSCAMEFGDGGMIFFSKISYGYI